MNKHVLHFSIARKGSQVHLCVNTRHFVTNSFLTSLTGKTCSTSCVGKVQWWSNSLTNQPRLTCKLYTIPKWCFWQESHVLLLVFLDCTPFNFRSSPHWPLTSEINSQTGLEFEGYNVGQSSSAHLARPRLRFQPGKPELKFFQLERAAGII